MKCTIITIVGLLFSVTTAFADLCSDLKNSFSQRITLLEQDHKAALSQTNDSNIIAALQGSIVMQMDQIKLEMDSALNSAGCLIPSTPSTEILTDPPTDDPVDLEIVSLPDSDEIMEPPVTVEDALPDDEIVTCSDDKNKSGRGSHWNRSKCGRELKEYAELLKSQGLRKSEIAKKVLARAIESNCRSARIGKRENDRHHSIDCDDDKDKKHGHHNKKKDDDDDGDDDDDDRDNKYDRGDHKKGKKHGHYKRDKDDDDDDDGKDKKSRYKSNKRKSDHSKHKIHKHNKSCKH